MLAQKNRLQLWSESQKIEEEEEEEEEERQMSKKLLPSSAPTSR
jgi:hypothetical protein